MNRELSELLDWVQTQKRSLDTLPAISAEQSRLAEQIEQFRTPYADILAKEGQVIVAGLVKPFHLKNRNYSQKQSCFSVEPIAVGRIEAPIVGTQ